MTETRFIVAGSFIDGSGADVRKNVYLAIQNGTIIAIGYAKNLPQTDIDSADNLSHCTILPALIDCSVSLSQSPSMDEKTRFTTKKPDLAKKAAMLERHLNYCHTHGVLGVAENSLDNTIDQEILYNKNLDKTGMINIRISSPLQQARQDYSAGKTTTVDFLRIEFSNNIEDKERPKYQYSHEQLCSMLLNKGSKKTVVVANGSKEVEEALEAGCDAIEQGYNMGKNNLRRMAENKILWIPSVFRAKNALDSSSTSGDVCCRFSLRSVAPGKPDPEAEYFWKQKLDEQLAQLRYAKKLGVVTAVGTGAGSVGILHGESVAEEMKLFIKAGYSLEETIRCASINGAKFFGMKNLGELTVGQKATFLITRGAIQQLPRKLSYLEGIYVNGTPSIMYHKNPAMKV